MHEIVVYICVCYLYTLPQHLHEESVYIVYLVLMIIDMQFAILI